MGTKAPRRGNRKPGKSAGAGKLPPDAADLRLLARDAALAALKRLSDLSRSEDERVALAATQELLNRAFGKATASGADEAPATAQPLVIKIVRFGESDSTKSQGDGQS
jgi:hypothetical protein